MTSGFHDDGLLRPGSSRLGALTSDPALVDAIVEVERAWLRVLGQDADLAVPTDIAALRAGLERAGNPVVPVLDALRDSAPPLLHKGLTSQDTLDTALMLLTQQVRRRVLADADALCMSLTDLAVAHRDTVMVGRTLTQPAVPITFGLKVAQWLTAIREAAEGVRQLSLPVQCGGAAGTLSLIASLTDARTAPARLAAELDLDATTLPWHTRSRPLTAVADAVTALTDALGTMAADIALLSRPEIAEVSEGAGGTSSTMPHKRNPVLSVLIRSAALQAPPLAAGLHTAAAQMVDERPDGAWHAQWQPYRDLLALAVVATSQARDLIEGLQVNAEVMTRRAVASARELLAEHPGAASVDDYLGIAGEFVEAAVAGSSPLELAFTRLTPAREGDLLIVGAGLGTSVVTLWQPVVDLLDVEVVGVDLPGHGASPAATGPVSVSALAEAIRRWVAANALGRRVWFAGVSMAGGIALELALRPGPFDGVVSIASAARLGTPRGWRERADLVRRAGTAVMVSGSAQRWFATGFTERAPGLAGQMLDDLVEVDAQSYARCCEALADYDLRWVVGAARVPVVYMPGELDTVVGPEVAERDADQTPGSCVCIAKGAAHQPPAEVPEQVAQVLREVLHV